MGCRYGPTDARIPRRHDPEGHRHGQRRRRQDAWPSSSTRRQNTADEKVEQTFDLYAGRAERRRDAGPHRHGRPAAARRSRPKPIPKRRSVFRYVRNSVGLSRNLRNNAVYDRRWDWVLIGPADGATRITPKIDEESKRTFGIESKGASLRARLPPAVLPEAPWATSTSNPGPTRCGKARSRGTAPGGRTVTVSRRKRSTRCWRCSSKSTCPTSATTTCSSTTPTSRATAVVPRTG